MLVVVAALPAEDLAGALGDLYVGAAQRGQLNDPQTRAQEQLQDRPIARRRQPVDRLLERAQLLGGQRSSVTGGDSDASHGRRGERAAIQQRRRGREREVDPGGREPAIDQAPAPVRQQRATIVLRGRREESVHSPPAARSSTSSTTQRR
jgi:hypothetical protein